VGGVSSSTIGGFDTRISSNTSSITTLSNTVSSNTISITALSNDISLRATTASPSFTGTPTAPTPAAGSQDTQIATTAFVATFVTNASVADASASVKGKLH
jgi:hypothetical protein